MLTDRERILAMPQEEAIATYGYEEVVAALLEARTKRTLRTCAEAAKRGNSHPAVVV